MKQFIKTTALFIPFSIVVYIVLIIVMSEIPIQLIKPNINYQKGSYGHLYSRINEIQNYKDVDVLFLGSSHAYRGFDTREYENVGIKAFNLGSSSQTPIQTEVLLERYLDILNPKIVIFETSPLNFTSDGVESSINIIANDKNDALTITNLIVWDNIKTVNTAIAGFFKDFTEQDEDFIEDKIKGEDVYISGGYVEKTIKHFSPQEFNKTSNLIKANQLESFSRIVNTMNKKHINLFLVQAPITKLLNSSFINTEEFDSTMQFYSNYYNFNELIELDDSIHFYDSHHMNQNGVSIFNKKIIEILKLSY